jgi:hypothetical protein
MAALLPLHKTPLLVFGLLLLQVLGGCTQVLKYRELEVPDRTFGEIWVGMQVVTRQMGYRAKRVDRGKKVFESSWRTQTRFPRGSMRHRLRAEVERIDPKQPDQPGWRVRCCVEKQRVTTVGRSLNPGEDDWEPDGQDLDREKRFVRLLRGELRLQTREPTKPR